MSEQEHKTIWLQPWCSACENAPGAGWDGNGRLWCQDDVWGACEECGRKPVKYTLAAPSPIGKTE